MIEQVGRVRRRNCVDKEFHNIRELLEMLMTEMSPIKHKLRMRPNLGWAPPTDVYETETEFVVTMDIAGMDRQNIDIFTDGKTITIRGVRSQVAPHGSWGCQHPERLLCRGVGMSNSRTQKTTPGRHGTSRNT